MFALSVLYFTYFQSAELFATFKNGIVYEFVPGVTLNTRTVYEPKIWPLVATHMARMHKLPLSPEETIKEPMLKTKTIKFLDLIPETFSDPEKHRRYLSCFIQVIHS